MPSPSPRPILRGTSSAPHQRQPASSIKYHQISVLFMYNSRERPRDTIYFSQDFTNHKPCTTRHRLDLCPRIFGRASISNKQPPENSSPLVVAMPQPPPPPNMISSTGVLQPGDGWDPRRVESLQMQRSLPEQQNQKRLALLARRRPTGATVGPAPIPPMHDSAVRHPVFFTPRLMPAPEQHAARPPGVVLSPVAHGYVYQNGQRRVGNGVPKL